MLDSESISQAGEDAVIEHLRREGWRLEKRGDLPGKTDVQFRRYSKPLLVQVKSAVKPNAPATLSSDEERDIKSRATTIGAEAREYRVWLGVGERGVLEAARIGWRPLT